MKRSEIQNAIRMAERVLNECQINLPMFAHWTKQDFVEKADQIEALRKSMLGWDVTDFGNGDFLNLGAVLFTLRNGVEGEEIGTPYAEKLIILHEGQRLPIHMHKAKTEDIISRTGAPFQIRLWNTGADGKPDMKKPVDVYCDGQLRTFPAGETITIKNGNSISLTPYMYHTFWGGTGGMSVIGEVSSLNDDNIDNYFAERVNRFAEVEEDEEQLFILCNEYGTLDQ